MPLNIQITALHSHDAIAQMQQLILDLGGGSPFGMGMQPINDGIASHWERAKALGFQQGFEQGYNQGYQQAHRDQSGDNIPAPGLASLGGAQKLNRPMDYVPADAQPQEANPSVAGMATDAAFERQAEANRKRAKAAAEKAAVRSETPGLGHAFTDYGGPPVNPIKKW